MLVISNGADFKTNENKSNRCVDNKMECICSGQYTFSHCTQPYRHQIYTFLLQAGHAMDIYVSTRNRIELKFWNRFVRQFEYLIFKETISLLRWNGAYIVIRCQNGRRYKEIVAISGLYGVEVIAMETLSIVNRHINTINWWRWPHIVLNIGRKYYNQSQVDAITYTSWLFYHEDREIVNVYFGI